MTELLRDRLFATLIVLLAVAGLLVSQVYSADTALFPRALCSLLLILALTLLWRSFTSSQPTPGNVAITAWGSALLVIAAVIAWVAGVMLFNIELATLLFCLVSLRVLGLRDWWWTWNTAAGLMLFVHLLFFRLLDVTRPDSWLF